MLNNDELDMSSNIFDLNKDNSNLNIKDNDDINKIISNISENLENKKTFEKKNNLLQNNNINKINNNNIYKNHDILTNNNIIPKDKNNFVNLNHQNNTNLNIQNNTNLKNKDNTKLNNQDNTKLNNQDNTKLNNQNNTILNKQNTNNLNYYKNIFLETTNKFINKNKKKIKKTIITIFSFMVINSHIIDKIISRLPTKINNLCQNLIKSIFFILINYLIKKNI